VIALRSPLLQRPDPDLLEFRHPPPGSCKSRCATARSSTVATALRPMRGSGHRSRGAGGVNVNIVDHGVSQSRPTLGRLWGTHRGCAHSWSRWQVLGDPHPLTRIAHELNGALPVPDRHVSWCSRAPAVRAPRFELIGKIRVHDATPVVGARSWIGRNNHRCSERDTVVWLDTATTRTRRSTPLPALPPLAPACSAERCHQHAIR
jgi:hypothetical protein